MIVNLRQGQRRQAPGNLADHFAASSHLYPIRSNGGITYYKAPDAIISLVVVVNFVGLIKFERAVRPADAFKKEAAYLHAEVPGILFFLFDLQGDAFRRMPGVEFRMRILPIFSCDEGFEQLSALLGQKHSRLDGVVEFCDQLIDPGRVNRRNVYNRDVLKSKGPGENGGDGNGGEDIGCSRGYTFYPIHDNKGQRSHQQRGPVGVMPGCFYDPVNRFIMVGSLVHLDTE